MCATFISWPEVRTALLTMSNVNAIKLEPHSVQRRGVRIRQGAARAGGGIKGIEGSSTKFNYACSEGEGGGLSRGSRAD